MNTPADIPRDFQTSVEGRTFETGIFLPQDDAHWFTRPPRYPARLLLLSNRWLSIVPHPASGLRTVDLNLDELVQLETAGILLIGWIQFTTRRSTERVDYNTRTGWVVDKFMAALRVRWLGEPSPKGTASSKMFGAELDIKFRNLLLHELDRNEAVLLQCFTPPIKVQKRFLGLRRVSWRPGHLVALTSGNRLLWLKDEYRNRWERYAGIAVSVPTSLFQSSKMEASPSQEELIFHFLSGTSWRISIFWAASDWIGFADALSHCLAP
ncbi:MAG: hypothetical protein WBW33_30395, partial [Bryobacteraceae bacterium]